ncbi:NAD(P)-dependent methylenetetrahydromethanopterin dehydrogenase [Hyphomicrobium sp.]|uniref:NAD(P)-dependent methylenetetrahydromethanopterin dehydrogenase n=1 Tax=Hyphomicrobium sp. TaxID=82 RepID=UPI003F72A146
MRLSVDMLSGEPVRAPHGDLVPAVKKRSKKRADASQAAVPKTAKSRSRKKAQEKAVAPGTLPILYMLSPQKFMSPFDCNMAVDSGYTVVLPYDNVGVSDVGALVQDAIFSRPPNARTGIFIGGKDITLALEMMNAARHAMVPSFEVSVFADPGGSFTTAAAMVACVERVLARNFSRGFSGLRVAVFGATGVVGFASAVIAANEGADVRVVAHDTLEPLIASAEFAADTFNVSLKPVAGHTDALKAKILRTSDVIFTAGPAGVNILTRRQLARAPGLLVTADVNAVTPYGVEGIDLFMNGTPLPGCSTLGVGALTIGDVKYKTQAGLFQRMIHSKDALELDFRDAFLLAREIVSGGPKAA